MSRRILLAIVLVLSAVFFSCSGEDGAVGPTGKSGNANVIVYQYDTRTTSSGSFSYDFEASRGLVDSSLVLAYYYYSAPADTFWYAVPGMGPAGAFLTRSIWSQTSTSPSTFSYWVGLMNPDGSGSYYTSTTFLKFKIVLAPASVIIPATSRGLLNLSDYNAVADYLGLSE